MRTDLVPEIQDTFWGTPRDPLDLANSSHRTQLRVTICNCKAQHVTAFLRVVHRGGEGTPLRGEVKKLTVTSHQLLRTPPLGTMGVDQLRSANDIQPQKIEARRKVLILRGTFFRFRSIFDPFWQFRSFFEVDFLLFDVFSIPGDGIRASRTLD
jgi:hypothetical protein